MRKSSSEHRSWPDRKREPLSPYPRAAASWATGHPGEWAKEPRTKEGALLGQAGLTLLYIPFANQPERNQRKKQKNENTLKSQQKSSVRTGGLRPLIVDENPSPWSLHLSLLVSGRVGERLGLESVLWAKGGGFNMADLYPVTMGTGFSQALGSTQIQPWSQPSTALHRGTSSRAGIPGAAPLTTSDIVPPAYPLPPSECWELK